jgi:hypothetical protein
MNGINKFRKNNEGEMVPVQTTTTNSSFAFGGTAGQPRGLTTQVPNFSQNPFLKPANGTEAPRAPIFGNVSLFNTNVKPSTDLSA